MRRLDYCADAIPLELVRERTMEIQSRWPVAIDVRTASDGSTATPRHTTMSASEQPPTRPVQVKLVLLGTFIFTRSVLGKRASPGSDFGLRLSHQPLGSWGCPSLAAVHARGRCGTLASAKVSDRDGPLNSFLPAALSNVDLGP